MLGRHAFVVAAAEGIIRMWSMGAEALFGHREHHWTAFHAAMASGVIDTDRVSVPVVHADGTEVEHPGRLGLLNDAAGTTIGAVVTWEPARDHHGGTEPPTIG